MHVSSNGGDSALSFGGSSSSFQVRRLQAEEQRKKEDAQSSAQERWEDTAARVHRARHEQTA